MLCKSEQLALIAAGRIGDACIEDCCESAAVKDVLSVCLPYLFFDVGLFVLRMRQLRLQFMEMVELRFSSKGASTWRPER